MWVADAVSFYKLEEIQVRQLLNVAAVVPYVTLAVFFSCLPHTNLSRNIRNIYILTFNKTVHHMHCFRSMSTGRSKTTGNFIAIYEVLRIYRQRPLSATYRVPGKL